MKSGKLTWHFFFAAFTVILIAVPSFQQQKYQQQQQQLPHSGHDHDLEDGVTSIHSCSLSSKQVMDEDQQLLSPRDDRLHSIRSQWKSAAEAIESIAYPMKRPLMNMLDTLAGHRDLPISDQCRHGLKHFSQSLARSESSAMKMLDSFSKFIPGMMTRRRNSDFGAYDQCLKVEGGRYTLVNLIWPLPSNSRDFEAALYEDLPPAKGSLASQQLLMSRKKSLASSSKGAKGQVDLEKVSRALIQSSVTAVAADFIGLEEREDGRHNSNHSHPPLLYQVTKKESETEKESSFSSKNESGDDNNLVLDSDESLWYQEYSINYQAFYSSQPLVAGCLPSQCTEREIRLVLEGPVVSNLIAPLKFKVKSTEVAEQPYFDDELEREYPALSWIRLMSRTILYLLIVTTLVSTLCGIYYPYLPSDSLLSCFDAIKNTKKLLEDSKNPETERFRFFNGVKSAYMLVATAGHFLLPMNFELFGYYHEVHRMMLEQPFLRSITRSSSTFFSLNVVLASSLSVISWMPELKRRKGKLSFISFIVLRILRTLPVTLVCIMFSLSLPIFPSGSGPNLNTIQKNMTANCLKNGWKELLFISNHQQPSEVCIMVGWYLSADFQLYALSFIAIYLLYNRPSLGLKVVWGMILGGPVLQFIVMLKNNITPTITMFSFEGNTRSLMDNVSNLHFHSYNYLSTYGIGLLLGYLMTQGVMIPKKYHTLVWTVSWSSLGLVLQVPNVIYDGEHFILDSRFMELLFGSVIRTVLSFCCFALILNAFSDPGSLWTKFFSCKFFTVLARISFSIFMIHPFVIIFLLGTRLHTIDFDMMTFTMFSLYMYFVSFILGYLVFLCVEAPFVNIIKSVLKIKGNSSSSFPSSPAASSGEEISGGANKSFPFSEKSQQYNHPHLHLNQNLISTTSSSVSREANNNNNESSRVSDNAFFKE